MSKAKKYHVGDSGLVEGEALGRITVYLAADYDAALGEIATLEKLLDQTLEAGEIALNAGLRITLERDSLQQRLTVQDQREDDQKQRIASIVGKKTHCKACGSDNLFWFAHNKNHSVVQNNRLNTNDVTCLLVLGCSDCSETLMTVSADKLAERMTAALNPTAEAVSHDR